MSDHILLAWALIASASCILQLAVLLEYQQQTKQPHTPLLMPLEDVEAALQAARELTPDEIPALAATLVLPATPKTQPSWTGHQCRIYSCPQMAVVRWVGDNGSTWYDCSLHWEYDRKRCTIAAFETLT